MALTPGTRLGVHEVIAPIGEGGMGQVYRARDTKLDRDVAIKILPQAFAHDPDRLARFLREARTLAALNHPNIAAIYGLEESGGITALVMELVAGDDLSQRIARGAMPIDEALPIATQIAEAVEAAHEQGIVHRDLKPANIKVRPDGTVKVLDFGLAKLVQGEGERGKGEVALSMSPTVTSPALMTGVGTLLGTAAYMSPEQARGKPADKRSDIWAFGCVLFEMLTGKQAFAGEQVADVLAAVLKSEPEWRTLPTDLPTSISRLLRRCLEKDGRRRLDSAAAVRFDIEEAGSSSSDTAAPRKAVRFRPVTIAATAIAGAFAAAVAGGLFALTYGRAVPSVTGSTARFVVPLASSDELSPTNRQVVAIAPDGHRFAYLANAQLWVRDFDSLDPVRLAGPEPDGAQAAPVNPFFSPDGESIAYQQANTLKKVSVKGGTPITIALGVTLAGATWPEQDVIFFARGNAIWKIPASGGVPEKVVEVDPARETFRPQLLPGSGQMLVFTVADANSNFANPSVVAQSLGGGPLRTLFPGASDGRYLASGHFVYAAGDDLLAVPFDPVTLSARGQPVPVVGDVLRAQTNSGGASGVVQLAVSDDGTLVYVPQDAVPFRVGLQVGADTNLGLVSMDGSEPSRLLLHTQFSELNASFSPDGRWVVDESAESGRKEVYVRPFPAVEASRWQISTDGGSRPVWSRRGDEIFYAAPGDRLMTAAVRTAATFSVDAPRMILRGPYFSGNLATGGAFIGRVFDASPDGQRFLMTKASDETIAPRFVVVENWFEELKRLVPIK